MRIAIILENSPDCELDREVIRVKNDSDVISNAIKVVLEKWTLAEGDTIKIREIES
jgi:hypothetical protein